MIPYMLKMFPNGTLYMVFPVLRSYHTIQSETCLDMRCVLLYTWKSVLADVCGERPPVLIKQYFGFLPRRRTPIL